MINMKITNKINSNTNRAQRLSELNYKFIYLFTTNMLTDAITTTTQARTERREVQSIND